jgi:hypothetical protein
MRNRRLRQHNPDRIAFATLVRQLLNYRARHGCTYQDLADLLDVPLVTLKTWIYRRNIARPITAERIRRFLRSRDQG